MLEMSWGGIAPPVFVSTATTAPCALRCCWLVPGAKRLW